MNRERQPQDNRAAEQWRFTVTIHRTRDGPAIGYEPVMEDDFVDVDTELLRDGFLRKFQPQVRLDELSLWRSPILEPGSGRCVRYAVEAVGPRGGKPERLSFSVRSLCRVASRAAARLVATGALAQDPFYLYRLEAEQAPLGFETTQPEAAPFGVTVTSPALVTIPVRLNDLLAHADRVGSEGDDAYRVFYTKSAFRCAERFARKGGEAHPPRETGAILIGPLCSCPETGELFAIVCEAQEVTDAQATEHSLYYSPESWRRIQSIMRHRQAHSATRAHRILGQSHGHNFIPADGAPPCLACDKLPVCTRTSAFVSSDDLNWSRAVFSRQPWQLCHIFGLNARRELVHSLFGLRDGTLLPRNFHLIGDDDLPSL